MSAFCLFPEMGARHWTMKIIAAESLKADFGVKCLDACLERKAVSASPQREYPIGVESECHVAGRLFRMIRLAGLSRKSEGRSYPH